jgi:hypothetical protein
MIAQGETRDGRRLLTDIRERTADFSVNGW